MDGGKEMEKAVQEEVQEAEQVEEEQVGGSNVTSIFLKSVSA